jgi:hypothetical protein
MGFYSALNAASRLPNASVINAGTTCVCVSIVSAIRACQNNPVTTRGRALNARAMSSHAVQALPPQA